MLKRYNNKWPRRRTLLLCPRPYACIRLFSYKQFIQWLAAEWTGVTQLSGSNARRLQNCMVAAYSNEW